MSSTLAPHTAAACIDGDPSTFCHTLENVESPWLSVQLPAPDTDVFYVLLYNRAQCCQDRLSPFQLWAGGSSGDYDSGTSTRCGFLNATAGEPSENLTVPTEIGPFSFRCTAPPGTSKMTMFNFDLTTGLTEGWTTGPTSSSCSPTGSSPFGFCRRTGRTPSGTSGYTGPNAGYAGSAYYYYAEVSSSSHNLFEMSYDGSACTGENEVMYSVDFAYHMFGAATGTLELVTNHGTTVWTRSGAQNDQATWLTATVVFGEQEPLTTSFKFKVTRGNGYYGDIAIDNVNVNCFAPLPLAASHVTLVLPGSSRTLNLGEIEVFGAPAPPPSPPPPTSPPPSPPPYPPGSNFYLFTFDSSDEQSNGWTTGPTNSGNGAATGSSPYGFNWRTGSTPSVGSGPVFGYGGSGRYYYAEASSPRQQGDIFDLVYDGTSLCGSGVIREVEFKYHMFGPNMGSLALLSDPAGATLWSQSGQPATNPNDWKGVSTGHLSTGTTGIKFRATRGNGWGGDIGVDNVLIRCGA